MSADKPASVRARTFRLRFSGEAEITVRDDRVILRVTENRDADDVPEGQPGHRPEEAFRTALYRLYSEQDVLEMLLWNAAGNGIRQANRLDGWADLDRDAAEVNVESIEVEEYAEVDGE